MSPHKDIQNHRIHQNATISFGEWDGVVLQVLENDQWIHQDSKDQLVFLNARDTFHRVTEVTGHRLSVIFQVGKNRPGACKPRNKSVWFLLSYLQTLKSTKCFIL